MRDIGGKSKGLKKQLKGQKEVVDQKYTERLQAVPKTHKN